MNQDSDFANYQQTREQLFKLALRTFRYASRRSPFYKNFLAEKGFNPRPVKDYADFKTIPLLMPSDFREHSLEMVAVPDRQVWQVFSTSGSTGRPKFNFYSRQQLKLLGKSTATVLRRVGLATKGLRAGIFFPFGDLSASGALSVRSCELLNIPTICFGLNYPPELVVSVLEKIKPNLLYVFPSAFGKLITDLQKLNYQPRGLKIKAVIMAGEPPLREATRIKEFFHPQEMIETYASSDMASYIATSCTVHDGLHLMPLWVFPELINLDTFKLQSEGIGELVLTSIQALGTPLVRYRTGDLVKITNKRCSCGRTVPRLWIIGRTDNLIFLYGGDKFYVESEMKEALKNFPEVTGDYQVVVEKNQDQDKITLIVESASGAAGLGSKIAAAVLKAASALSVSVKQGHTQVPEVKIVKPGTIERTRGKIKKRVIDNRPKT